MRHAYDRSKFCPICPVSVAATPASPWIFNLERRHHSYKCDHSDCRTDATENVMDENPSLAV
jgi:hypothetical protein